MAISTLVGQNMGAGNIERASRVAQLGALFGFIVLTCAGLIAYGFAPEIVAFFIPADPAVIDEGARGSWKETRITEEAQTTAAVAQEVIVEDTIR